MKKITRNGVFETNSSSTHSFTIDDSGDYDTINLNEHNELEILFGEFGWEIASYKDVETRLSYVATFLFTSPEIYDIDNVLEKDDTYDYGFKYIGEDDRIIEFEKMLKEHTGAENIIYIIYDKHGYAPFGYIDHQSMDVGGDAYANMKNAIFGKNSELITDNDNY